MTGPTTTLRVRVGVAPRGGPDFPTDDEALGRAVLDRLVTRLERGPVGPAAVVLRADGVQILDMRPFLAPGRDTHRYLSALAGGRGVEALAVVGILTRRRREAPGPSRGTPDPGLRYGGVFVEWSDGRWWAGFRPLDDRMRLVPTDSDDIQRAVDGLPRPGGLGGWFSRARFQDLHAEVRPDLPAPPPPAEVVN